MLKIIPSLVFHGECREAFGFYASALQGKIQKMITFGDVPGEEKLGPEYQSRIMHAWLDVGTQSITGGDSPAPGTRLSGGAAVAIHTSDQAQARRFFEGLSPGANISMAFGPTPWSQGFGMLTDCFGTPWVINTTDV